MDILITKSCLLQTLISYYNILSEPNFGVAELDYNGNPKELPKKYQELIDNIVFSAENWKKVMEQIIKEHNEKKKS